MRAAVQISVSTDCWLAVEPLTSVSCSAMWMAVCVCSVTAPVLILDVPFANAMKMMSWRRIQPVSKRVCVRVYVRVSEYSPHTQSGFHQLWGLHRNDTDIRLILTLTLTPPPHTHTQTWSCRNSSTQPLCLMFLNNISAASIPTLSGVTPETHTGQEEAICDKTAPVHPLLMKHSILTFFP